MGAVAAAGSTSWAAYQSILAASDFDALEFQGQGDHRARAVMARSLGIVIQVRVQQLALRHVLHL